MSSANKEAKLQSRFERDPAEGGRETIEQALEWIAPPTAKVVPLRPRDDNGDRPVRPRKKAA